MIRRRKDEVLDLPPKLRTWLDVEVEAGTANAEMREVVESLLLARSGAVSQDSSRTRLLAQITKAREKLAAAKVNATIEGSKRVEGKLSPATVKKVEKFLKDAVV